MTTDSRAEYAIAAAKRGEFEHATTAVLDLIAEDWNNAEAHRAWGRLLLTQGKATDAAAALRVAADLDPRPADVHFDLAHALLTQADAAVQERRSVPSTKRRSGFGQIASR